MDLDESHAGILSETRKDVTYDFSLEEIYLKISGI